MKELELLQKIYDFEKIAYGYLKKFPQSEKFALATEIKNSLFELYKTVYKASKMENKKTTLREADVLVQHIKHLFRLANEFKFISKNGFYICVSKLVEIGKMVGAWFNNNK